MNFDFQSFLNVIITAGLAAVGYFYRQHAEDMKSLNKSINEIKVDLPSNYVRKDELSVHMNRIESMLNKIFDKLDNKVDK